jgi:hypothetical protein
VSWDTVTIPAGTDVQICRAGEVEFRPYTTRKAVCFAWPGPGPAGELLMFEHAGFKIRAPRWWLQVTRTVCPGSGPALAECPF